MVRQIDMNLYIKHLRERYWNAGKREKSMILDEFCNTSGYHRKHAIRMFSRKQLTSPRPSKKKRGRKPIYDADSLREPLRQIWLATDQMCSKRLRAAMPLWLPFYEAEYGVLDATLKS